MAIGPHEDPASRLTFELDEALGLLREFKHVADTTDLARDDAHPSNLLDQCLALCAERCATKAEPVRTVHHFACAGGTLISKCIASMPNTQLVSEVDPWSTPVKPPARPLFAPTDMVTLMRQSTRGASADLIAKLFLGDLAIVYSESRNRGLRLVLRDHAHGHYCRGDVVPDRPNLLRLVASQFPTLSVVTVRDPIDSYLSLRVNGWVNFTPATFDEYCSRYLAFLREFEGTAIVRYEDFVKDPDTEMGTICNLLDLPFNPYFRELFDVYKISGDSGRRGNVIETRSRRSVDADLAAEIETSTNYKNLRTILSYPG